MVPDCFSFLFLYQLRERAGGDYEHQLSPFLVLSLLQYKATKNSASPEKSVLPPTSSVRDKQQVRQKYFSPTPSCREPIYRHNFPTSAAGCCFFGGNSTVRKTVEQDVVHRTNIVSWVWSADTEESNRSKLFLLLEVVSFSVKNRDHWQ